MEASSSGGEYMTGKDRMVLADIDYPDSPAVLYRQLMRGEGYPYKTDKSRYLLRDRALVSILYVLGLRISEACSSTNTAPRLVKKQFVERTNKRTEEQYIHVKRIILSKRRFKDKPRLSKYRDGKLPLEGERSCFTEIIQQYLATLEDEERLFPFSPTRGWQVVKALLPEITEHWLRGFCEDFLYSEWDHDMLAVADYLKIHPLTLSHYIRRRHERYRAV